MTYFSHSNVPFIIFWLIFNTVLTCHTKIMLITDYKKGNKITIYTLILFATLIMTQGKVSHGCYLELVVSSGLTVQAALTIRGYSIRGFDHLRT
jgi:hypothetical protein